jgi:ubiquinone/menaquinone biosynthesis C-methylase UbiE
MMDGVSRRPASGSRFVVEKERALAEMVRVTKPGGWVGPDVLDRPGGRDP